VNNEALGSKSAGVWVRRLGNPAIGNICAALALVVAVAAGVGFLRQGLFWLIFSYVTLIVTLAFVAILGRRRTQALRAIDAERATLGRDITETRAELARAKRDLAEAREEVEGCESGYASLRTAVIQTARWGGSDAEDFDDEVADALRSLGGRLQRSLRARP
jgi:hypothetical protein